MTRQGRAKEKPPLEPGLIPAPREFLVWRDGQHFDHWQDLPCTLCGQLTPMRSHSGEPVHKACAEGRLAASPVEARLGRFASDLAPKPKGQGDHA
ncbi:hypothetical protein [Streptomyces lavenduligriseus]|uniref:Uncharacterized protein n=1 Tax=Streptomyces lavenduligriseus TaxID=67315 RepID=A0ABT0P3H0_9ACTN|nr:hypothetical protein [Streptomyces lavenduligriseus]MCL3998155.1 hypothetical protein [Streptomyces lavenduligriseus]